MADTSAKDSIKNNNNNQLTQNVNSINPDQLKNRSQRSVLSEYVDEDVQKIHRELKERIQDKRKKDKNKGEEVKYVSEKLGFKFRFKRWWFGMDKEVKRISWPTSKQLITSFLIVISVIAILTALFFGINEIFISLGILK